jgi:serine/threonine protein kinase
MLEALAFLHAEGCMHRDIKAENILASDSPLKAIIIDFGCATWERTSKDHLKGTIRYLAPEIIALKEKTAPPNTTYDVSADVWGMGLTAYELIHSSRVKFGRISRKVYDEELLPKIATSRIYSMDSPGNWASALIREMLHWDPRSRIKAEQAYQQCPRFHAGREQRQLQPGKREHGD